MGEYERVGRRMGGEEEGVKGNKKGRKERGGECGSESRDRSDAGTRDRKTGVLEADAGGWPRRTALEHYLPSRPNRSKVAVRRCCRARISQPNGGQ